MLLLDRWLSFIFFPTTVLIGFSGFDFSPVAFSGDVLALPLSPRCCCYMSSNWSWLTISTL